LVLICPEFKIAVSRSRYPGSQMHMGKIQTTNSVSRIFAEPSYACCGPGAVCFAHELYLLLPQPTKHPGLMYFCMDDMRAIRSLIDTLRIPSLEPRVKTFFLPKMYTTSMFLT